MGNPIKNALGVAKTIYYTNKAEKSNKQADILREYNQGKMKTKNYEPGSRGFQVQSVGNEIIRNAKEKALKSSK